MFFKSLEEKALLELINKLQMNMSNNYKDNAQANFAELEKLFEQIKDNKGLKEKQILHYEEIIEDYREKLKGYSHKDQKPYWQ